MKPGLYLEHISLSSTFNRGTDITPRTLWSWANGKLNSKYRCYTYADHKAVSDRHYQIWYAEKSAYLRLHVLQTSNMKWSAKCRNALTIPEWPCKSHRHPVVLQLIKVVQHKFVNSNVIYGITFKFKWRTTLSFSTSEWKQPKFSLPPSTRTKYRTSQGYLCSQPLATTQKQITPFFNEFCRACEVLLWRPQN